MRSLLEWHIGVVNLNRQYKIGDIEKNKDENGKPLNSAHIWKKSKKGELCYKMISLCGIQGRKIILNGINSF